MLMFISQLRSARHKQCSCSNSESDGIDVLAYNAHIQLTVLYRRYLTL